MNGTRPYWSPYVAGLALGVTLLATYLLMGFGLGASGAFAQIAARLEVAVAPGRAQANPYLVGYLEAGRLWAQWIVVEMVGVLVGAGLGAWTAGRLACVAFGFVLERGGLGDPKKLTGLFYLEDFTMLQVMFTAIAVAAAGLGALSLLGVVDLTEIAVQPTYLWPQAVGGLILGVGFALGGY